MTRWSNLVVGGTGAATIAAVATAANGESPVALCCFAAASLLLVLVVWLGWSGTRPDIRLVVATSLVVIAASVGIAPSGSRDLWSYAAYGREVAVYHQSPYLHRPAEHPADPIVERVSPGWRHTRSVYGPVFVGLAAGIALVTSNPLYLRLAFQLLAAIALLASLLMVWRRSRDPIAVAVIGVNPAIILFTINGGHNDLMVGTVVLAAASVAARGRHPATAGLLIGLAALVKITALLALVGLVVWLWPRERARAAAAAAAGLGIVAAGYSLIGGRQAVALLLARTSNVSRVSVWDGLVSRLPAHVVWPVVALAVLMTPVILAIGGGNQSTPLLAMGGACLAYLLVAPYVLPWYIGWSAPLLALHWRSKLGLIATVYSLAIAAPYLNSPALDPDIVHHFLNAAANPSVLLVEAAAVTLLVHPARPRLRIP